MNIKCILWTQSGEFSAVYPTIQEHFLSRQLTYGAPAHCSLNEHGWFKGMFPVQNSEPV